MIIETDASKKTGWSYHICQTGVVYSGVWPENFDLENESWGFINFKELWVAKKCIADQKQLLKGWRIIFRMDNSAAVLYVNFRYGDVYHLEKLAAELEFEERICQCWALAIHIKGLANVISDAGSRDTSFAEAWATDITENASLVDSIMGPIKLNFGPFSLDLFSDRNGINSQAPAWQYPELSAFELDDEVQGTIWAFPPQSIDGATLKWLNDKLKTKNWRVALILPADHGAP